jgi:hypothetical protein
VVFDSDALGAGIKSYSTCDHLLKSTPHFSGIEKKCVSFINFNIVK